MKAGGARALAIGALLISLCVWKFLVDDAYRSAFGSEFSFLDSDLIAFSVLGFAVFVPLVGAGFAFVSLRRSEHAKWLGVGLLCANLILPPLAFADMIQTGQNTSAMLDQR